MEWTYLTYTVADYGITFSLVLISIIGVFATFFSSKKGQEFVIERVIGVNPTKAHDDYHENDNGHYKLENRSLDNNGQHPEPTQTSLQVKQKSIFYIGIFCCLLGGTILSITAILMFQGCFLTSTRLLPGDNCPDNPMDCFIFGQSSFAPISNNVSFVCEPLEKAEFHTNVSNATAWCYGWIIRLQSTRSVLDQLGIAIALIGFFTTMMAVMVYLGKCKKTIILSIVTIASCVSFIIVLVVFKLSFEPLTYAILGLCIGLGIFGLLLFAILPKRVKQKSNGQIFTADINQPSVITYSTSSHAYVPGRTTTSQSNAKTPYRAFKVMPK
jgi:hypothetical protein